MSNLIVDFIITKYCINALMVLLLGYQNGVFLSWNTRHYTQYLYIYIFGRRY